VNYTVDPLRAFDVGLLMAAMQRVRSVAVERPRTLGATVQSFELLSLYGGQRLVSGVVPT